MSNYGEKVPGYEVGVLNDREVRAAAGIMFLFGMIVIFVGIGFNHTLAARFYIFFVWLDLTIRLINPKYSPFMLLGRLFVRNQKPEYVGAVQKRFAWLLGWIIFLPMLNWFVFHWDINFYRVLLCILCLTVVFLESAFSICVGCILYSFITGEKSKYCPGGACELEIKEPIQTFSPIQKVIVSLMIVILVGGSYIFVAKSEPKTFFGEFLHEMVLTKAQLQKEKEVEDAKLDKEFENDDDF